MCSSSARDRSGCCWPPSWPWPGCARRSSSGWRGRARSARHAVSARWPELEELLGEYAAGLGVPVLRGQPLTDLTQDGAGVTATVGGRRITACYLRDDLTGLLPRPDGIVAWTAAPDRPADTTALRTALHTWLGDRLSGPAAAKPHASETTRACYRAAQEAGRGPQKPASCAAR
jgi:hypothetical protein